MRGIVDILGSLRTALWLTGILMLLFLAGAFVMPVSERFRTIHDMPLLRWMPEHPFGVTWWLWGALGVLCLLTVNTLLCSVDSLRKKASGTQWLLLISPQVIHLGFLLMLVAHLASGVGGFKSLVVTGENTAFELPDGEEVRVTGIDLLIDGAGYVRDWTLRIEYFSGEKKLHSDSIRPNSPSFHKTTGIYVKDLQAYPRKLALLEIAREPGAPWALAGGALFMTGTLTLLVLRMRREGSLRDRPPEN
jgi:hypothetical protein